MPTTIDNILFTDIYGNTSPNYKFNAGDYVKAEINIGVTCTIVSSLSNQITYSALTGEVTINEGSWYDEGFRIGDSVTFLDVDSSNVVVGTFNLTIISIPTDKTIVCSGLPNANNGLPGSNIWVFYKNSTKDEIELNLNWLSSTDVSTNPSMDSLIDGESLKLVVNSVSSLAVGGLANFSQIGKKSGGFEIQTAVIERWANTTYANATKFNYKIILELKDNGVLFPDEYIGTECLKFVFKLIGKQNNGDADGQELYYNAGANSGWFNEAYNSDVSDVESFATNQKLYYNDVNTISFSFLTNNSAPSNFEIGSCYASNDSTYNHNQAESQNKYLALLKTGLISSANIGTTYTSDQLTSAYNNLFYTIRLNNVTITPVGSQLQYDFSLDIDFKYIFNGASTSGFGNFLENRGIGEQNFYLWVKVGNTNVLVSSGPVEKKMPVGVAQPIETTYIINHDNNYNYNDTNPIIAVDNDDINEEDDLAFLCDFALNTNTANYEALNVYIVSNTAPNTDEFILEQMTFDLQNQDFNNFVDIFQNVANDLPTSSNKKTAMLKGFTYSAGFMNLRLYYPFVVNWKYWIKQLNATSYFKSIGADTKRWSNYTFDNGYKTYVKLGFVRDGVEDYYYKEFRIWKYDEGTAIQTTIELIDKSTLLTASNIIEGKEYTIRATHVNTAQNWNFLNAWGQITIEPKESQPRYLVSNEIDADLNNNLLIPNQYKRVNMTLTAPDTIVLECDLDVNLLSQEEYCITSKISQDGTNNNPIFVNKLTEDNLEKITEDNTNVKIKE